MIRGNPFKRHPKKGENYYKAMLISDLLGKGNPELSVFFASFLDIFVKQTEFFKFIFYKVKTDKLELSHSFALSVPGGDVFIEKSTKNHLDLFHSFNFINSFI